MDGVFGDQNFDFGTSNETIGCKFTVALEIHSKKGKGLNILICVCDHVYICIYMLYVLAVFA